MSGDINKTAIQKCKNLNDVPFLCTKFFSKKGTLFKRGHYLRKYGALYRHVQDFREEHFGITNRRFSFTSIPSELEKNESTELKFDRVGLA